MSKTITLLILGITAISLSRLMFFLFDDPEGPNLLVVIGMAAALYLLSLAAYFSQLQWTSKKRLFTAVIVQALLAIMLSFILR